MRGAAPAKASALAARSGGTARSNSEEGATLREDSARGSRLGLSGASGNTPRSAAAEPRLRQRKDEGGLLNQYDNTGRVAKTLEVTVTSWEAPPAVVTQSGSLGAVLNL
jgi:hypothetical protein